MAGAVCGRYPLACRLISVMAFTPVFFSPRSWEFFWRDFGSPSGRCSFTARIFLSKSKRRTGARWPRLSETTIGTAGEMIGPCSSNGSAKFSASSGIPKSRRRMPASAQNPREVSGGRESQSRERAIHRCQGRTFQPTPAPIRADRLEQEQNDRKTGNEKPLELFPGAAGWEDFGIRNIEKA